MANYYEWDVASGTLGTLGDWLESATFAGTYGPATTLPTSNDFVYFDVTTVLLGGTLTSYETDINANLTIDGSTTFDPTWGLFSGIGAGAAVTVSSTWTIGASTAGFEFAYNNS